MRVLYIGAYRDASGWANAAINQILALDHVGVEVVPRCIRYGNGNPLLPPRLAELEARDARGCDVVVQNTLPSAYEYDGRLGRHIGYYFVENEFSSSEWPRRINLMDEAWVPCGHNKSMSLLSGVHVPIRVVPPAADMSKYERSYKPLAFKKEMGDPFLFYFIGEAIRRKNIPDLVKAFHLEFDPSEPVELVLKTSVRGFSPEAGKAKMVAKCDLIKKALNLYGDPSAYKREIIITDHWSDEMMMRLHATGDCYVSASHGEGWGIPAFDAMAMGKTPILSDYSAHADFLTDAEGWPVSGDMEPVFGMQDAHGDLYTARSDWFRPSMRELRAAMRAAYTSGGGPKAEAGIKQAYNFSYEKVGDLMRGLLEC